MNSKPTKILITGGVRSGKSRYAVNLALGYPAPRVFLATAEAFDQGMKERIAKHQEERRENFLTVEEPVNLATKIRNLEVQPTVMVVDCLTVWVNNLLYHFSEKEKEIRKAVRDLIQAVEQNPFPVIFVTNEVGLGLIPDNTLSRRYIDELGNLNQSLARLCDEVIFMVSGIPAQIKGGIHARVDN